MYFKSILIVSLLSIAVSLRGFVGETKIYAQNMPDEIVQGLRAGDAKMISKYFNTSVELNFSESRGVYGKAQAEQILKDFFGKNAYANGKKFEYNLLHTSVKDNAQNYIGQLVTGKGTYRLYIFMKDQRIHQMRIDSND